MPVDPVSRQLPNRLIDHVVHGASADGERNGRKECKERRTQDFYALRVRVPRRNFEKTHARIPRAEPARIWRCHFGTASLNIRSFDPRVRPRSARPRPRVVLDGTSPAVRYRGMARDRLGPETDGYQLVAQSQLVILKRRETALDQSIHVATRKTPSNKGKLAGKLSLLEAIGAGRLS